ncbi:MAG: zinc ribbon domain-containing protein [Candidatus Omnitrophica bacterium]|nr:zinc ribbon domain-containing protein [Candidatus Omnitrophota bacterium]
MPIYSYLCKKCGEKFDLLVGVTSQPIEIACKKCGSKDVEKVFSSFSVGSFDKKDISGPSCSTGSCPTCF